MTRSDIIWKGGLQIKKDIHITEEKNESKAVAMSFCHSKIETEVLWHPED